MATNRALRAALLTRAGWSKQALSANVQRRKRHTPMSTEDATYLLAHEKGIKIDRYLSEDQIARVRTLHQASAGTSTQVPTMRAAVSERKKTISEIRFPGEFRTGNPLLSTGKLNEAREMAVIFPLLHVLENSIRELIRRVMLAHHGSEWWDTQLTSGKLKGVHQTAAARMRTESEKHTWHQRRGAHQIDYVDLGDLGSIILGKQDLFFPQIIPDRDWFMHFMRELEPSRNVVCHMNPLDDQNVTDVKSWFRKWERLVANALSRGTIPNAASSSR